MRFRSPLRVSVVRREEKEGRLKEFIVQHLAAPNGDDDIHGSRRFLMVARSVESPVAKATAALSSDIAASGYAVRLILAQVDQDTFPQGWNPTGGAIAFDHEIRWAKNPRLIEAHEQLVLGPQTCWIGDCMRREPSKCDAYESYVEGCGEAAGCATVSFERLWSASEPLLSHTAAPRGDMGPFTIVLSAANEQPSAGTRH